MNPIFSGFQKMDIEYYSTQPTIYYFLATFTDFSCAVHDDLIYKLTVTMSKCSDVTILATSYFTRNVFGECLPILYKNRSPGKSKQDIHLIFSVFIYSNIVERINEVWKKIGNRPETAKSAPSPFWFKQLFGIHDAVWSFDMVLNTGSCFFLTTH